MPLLFPNIVTHGATYSAQNNISHRKGKVCAAVSRGLSLGHLIHLT